MRILKSRIQLDQERLQVTSFVRCNTIKNHCEPPRHLVGHADRMSYRHIEISLRDAFVWATTPQGGGYWSRVCQYCSHMNNDPDRITPAMAEAFAMWEQEFLNTFTVEDRASDAQFDEEDDE